MQVLKQIEKYKKELIYIKCKRGMILMSLKAAFEADYALLGNSLSCLDKSRDKLVRLWNAASKLISQNRSTV